MNFDEEAKKNKALFLEEHFAVMRGFKNGGFYERPNKRIYDDFIDVGRRDMGPVFLIDDRKVS